MPAPPRRVRALLVRGPALAAAFTVAGGLAAPAGAIVRRHDRDDAAYRALAGRPHAACVVGGIANGTLVDRRWVATAAHVAAGVSPFMKTVRIAGVEVPFDSIRYHPEAFPDTGTGIDLALLRLARPVTSVAPARPYDRDDEAGQVVLFLGTGQTGDGRERPRGGAGTWRGAHNRVVAVTPRVVRFVFDAPPGGEELEGISGPGDSGGPALIERDGHRFLAGVSSTNQQPDGQPLCTYGTIETYARVSPQRGWIDSVMAGRGRSPGSDWTPARDLAAAGWPGTPVARAAREWFAARNANEPARLEAILAAHADSAYRSRRTPEQRRATWAGLWARFGAYTPVATSERLDGTLAVLVRAANEGLWLDYRFVPSPGEDGRLGRIESIDLNAPNEPFVWPRR